MLLMRLRPFALASGLIAASAVLVPVAGATTVIAPPAGEISSLQARATSLEQLDEVAKALTLTLHDDDYALLEQASAWR